MSRILLFISCFFVYTGKASRKKKEERRKKKEERKTEQAAETGYDITAADEKMRISKSAVVSRSDEFIRKYKKADKRSLY